MNPSAGSYSNFYSNRAFLRIYAPCFRWTLKNYSGKRPCTFNHFYEEQPSFQNGGVGQQFSFILPVAFYRCRIIQSVFGDLFVWTPCDSGKAVLWERATICSIEIIGGHSCILRCDLLYWNISYNILHFVSPNISRLLSNIVQMNSIMTSDSERHNEKSLSSVPNEVLWNTNFNRSRRRITSRLKST